MRIYVRFKYQIFCFIKLTIPCNIMERVTFIR
ncbi:MAG: DUF3709 domain-containing protein [Clostridia bacterium]|nr:DUF3709 domain-containing protein [Clostridia bacterium]